MNPLSERRMECPYCGEPWFTRVDTSAGSQRYIEDCPTCCRPIEMVLSVPVDGHWELVGYRDDE